MMGVGPEARVVEAMRYTSLNSGKRIRPFLVTASANLFNVDEAAALRVAAAVEFVHCYSLIHDDLPAMDDDDLRRGKPTCHIKFDEATAILAGDALLTKAFEVLADENTHGNSSVRVELISALAKAS
ncbi:MAG TPA: polyprenyl synthetase family protein, partial [Rhodospirillales bacterium]|nr:polyprenyl synthetase family protein [Rhodospirillales bacterium]